MLTRKMMLTSVMAGVLVALSLGVAWGQDNGGRGGRRGGFDPAQMRQRMMNRIKEQLGASDQEWQVLEPRIEKVQTLRREAEGGRMFMRRRGGNEDEQQPQSDLAKATQALQQTLENENATAEQIKAKLTALREAREKAKQQYEKASAELRELLTQRQEAQLVLMGILD